jgi:CDP-glucose 4,6-dehydratase
LFGESGQDYAEGWNFGPHEEDARPVQWIVEHLVNSWGNGATWQLDGGEHPHEANYLKLDISKVKARLGWTPSWQLGTALEKITSWHHAWLAGHNMQQLCQQQIAEFTQTINAKSN